MVPNTDDPDYYAPGRRTAHHSPVRGKPLIPREVSIASFANLKKKTREALAAALKETEEKEAEKAKEEEGKSDYLHLYGAPARLLCIPIGSLRWPYC